MVSAIPDCQPVYTVWICVADMEDVFEKSINSAVNRSDSIFHYITVFSFEHIVGKHPHVC